MQNILLKINIIIKKILGYEYNKWCIAVVNKENFLKNIIFYPPKNEFWADPFYFCYNNKDYCFFERYIYSTKKGELACAEIKHQKLINIKTILKKKYHLSFPNIFKYKKKIFLIPETYENKRLEIYICKKFPNQWNLYTTAFEGEFTCDPLILLRNKKLWLFINKTKKNLLNLNKDLYIYQIDSLKLKSIIPHKKNPVISNLNGGRNAAQSFFNNRFYTRISQNCKNLYGESINISKIKELSLDKYQEERLSSIFPDNFHDKNIIGIHSLSKFKNKYLVDLLLKFYKQK
jgi:hypothetical protein